MKPRILLVHFSFASPGGGNAVAAWAVQALRDAYDVTLLTWEPPDWTRVNDAFGTDIQTNDVRVRCYRGTARRLLAFMPTPLALLQLGLLQRAARRLAQRDGYDLVAGTNNELDAGAGPVLQYIHFPWGFYPRPDTDVRWYHLAPLVQLYRRMVFALCGVSRERIAANVTRANSAWTAEHFRTWYGTSPDVLYPPVHAPDATPPWIERQERFICVGRISPEKRIVEIIAILAGVRARGHDVALTICAQRDDVRYEQRVRAAVAANAEWVTLVVDSPRPALLTHLAHCRYGIHGMIGEHFGLAPAEMVRAGCVTFAPADGGPVEILGGDERVLYHSDADAVEKICALLDDPAECADVRRQAAATAKRFSAETFMREFRDTCAGAIAQHKNVLREPRAHSAALRAALKRALPEPFARGIGRVYRFLYPFWARSFAERTEEIDTPTGRYRLPLDAPHDYVAYTIRAGEMFEGDVVELAQRFVRPGDAVIDVGANFGQMAVAFSRMAGDAGEVIAIEANPDVFELLDHNLRINGCANARAVNAAAYRSSGGTLAFPTPRFWHAPSYGSYGVDPRRRRGRRVRAIAIDDLDLPNRIAFIKVDTQGCDLDVLRGARRTIARDRMPIVFEYEPEYDARFSTSFAQYETFIAEIGYRITSRVAQNILIEAAHEAPRAQRTASP